MLKNKLFTLIFIPVLILGAKSTVENAELPKIKKDVMINKSNIIILKEKTKRLDSLLLELEEYEKTNK